MPGRGHSPHRLPQAVLRLSSISVVQSRLGQGRRSPGPQQPVAQTLLGGSSVRLWAQRQVRVGRRGESLGMAAGGLSR